MDVLLLCLRHELQLLHVLELQLGDGDVGNCCIKIITFMKDYVYHVNHKRLTFKWTYSSSV